ncbi:UDP-2,4-diacetamido-2,4,6-trideoxy-beta-L-altropyranose hydrolase [Pseudomonas sp. D1-2]|uniref:UDP-2,4-diacetamido-2,4, 6-trideoxy-beta-L-altropyranose hydrolase n=1 Tax=unclassified Pseudomonas TaxID=196821 RepID=UPI003DA9954D
MKGMTVVFRADASLLIGSGHVMRCLTLAEALRAEGATCYFICREHPGNLLDFVRSKHFEAFALDATESPGAAGYSVFPESQLTHSAWLGASQTQDASECAALLGELMPDWLVVDHYALDARWENALKKYYNDLLVIDDLADRPHVCKILLDQNHGRTERDYIGLVPDGCQILAGARFALLRPEFAQLRKRSLERRSSSVLQHLLITMGGVDQANATGLVLRILRDCPLPDDCRISVIMGLNAPCLASVNEIAATMPWPTEVLVNVSDMAERMTSADLIIGAAGSTSWERCCLGVPTIMVVLADNQKSGAEALSRSGCVVLVGQANDVPERLPAAIFDLTQGCSLSELSRQAKNVCDGLGVERLIGSMGNG